MPPKSEEKKRRILEATESLFRQALEHDVTIEDIARIAQVSKGTIYLYFPDKDELFFQAEVYRMNTIVQRLQHEITGKIAFRLKLRMTLERLNDFFQDRIPILAPRKWMLGPQNEEGDRRREKWRIARGILVNYLASIMQQGIDEQALRPDIDPKVAARHLIVVMRSRRFEFITEPDLRPSLDDTLQLFLFGIAHVSAQPAEIDAAALEIAQLRAS